MTCPVMVHRTIFGLYKNYNIMLLPVGFNGKIVDFWSECIMGAACIETNHIRKVHTMYILVYL